MDIYAEITNRIVSEMESGLIPWQKEELVAEIGASALVHIAGLETPDSFRNNAGYIQNWLKVLRNDRKVIVSASGRADKAGLEIYDRCTLPQAGYLEQQFFHEMGADVNGNTLCALINDELELAVYLKYNVRELPCIAQWKVLRDAEYVLAFEPGNCHPIGRIAQKAKGAAEILDPMQSRTARLEIGVADGAEEIAALEAAISARRNLS